MYSGTAHTTVQQQGNLLRKDGDTTITIPDYIITSAKHDMYRYGWTPPTLYVCGTRKTVSILMPESGKRNARAEQLIRLATQLAHSRTVGEIDLVVLVTQAWASPAREPFIYPHKDKNRCEVLVISALDGQTKEQKLGIFQIPVDSFSESPGGGRMAI